MTAPNTDYGAPSLGPIDRITPTTDQPDWWCTYHGDAGYHDEQLNGCPACQDNPPIPTPPPLKPTNQK